MGEFKQGCSLSKLYFIFFLGRKANKIILPLTVPSILI